MAHRHQSHRLRLALAIVCLLTACAFPCLAQDLRYLRHQSWSTEDGLPQDSVHAISQTADGFLWIATEGGIARYDGLSFKTFNHANEPAFTSDDTCCLAEDSRGDLWIGTADGLLRLSNGRFRRFGTAEGLPSAAIQALVATPGGSLLVLTPEGLVQRAHDHFGPVPGLPPIAQGLFPAREGAWLQIDGRLFLYKNGSLGPPLKTSLDSPSPLAGIAEGPGGDLWLFSNTIVTLLNGSRTREWKTGSTLPGSRVETLLVDRQGTAWVGTNDGLVLLRKDSAETTTVPSLRGVSILQVFEDRQGNFWAGGETSGLHILRSLPFRSEPALADKPLTAVVQATDGTVWLGTRRDGLRRLRAGSLEQPAEPAALTSPVILSLASGPESSVWAGTPDGLNRIRHDGTVQRLTSADGLPDDYIQALQAARDGSLWAGTRRGLAHLQAGRITILTKADGLGGDLIGALLLTTRNDLWIGTSGGLSRRDPTGHITTFTARDGLPGSPVSAIAEDANGALWIATQDGRLTRYANGVFRPLPGAILSGQIVGLAADAHGQLWLRKQRGIERVPLQNLNRCADAPEHCAPALTHYGQPDGVPSEETIPGGSPALWPMADGELWFATRRGVAIVDTSHPAASPPPPPVVIERSLVDDTPMPAGQDLPYTHARYTFDYAGLDYTAPSEVRYRVMLEGFDSAWIDAGTRRSATYTGLPPGSFRFRVEARAGNGPWSAAPAELSFRIVPPFYRRWWFYLLAALCLAALVAAFYRLRLRRLEGRFNAVLQERNRMAREIHDTLAQDFVGVSVHLDLIAQFLALSKVDAALNQVRQTRKLVTDGLAEARRSIWELRANLTHNSLPSRLAQLVERYPGDTPKVHLKIGGAYRPIESSVENEFLRVAQEALSNIQHHAAATEATVDLRYGSDMLVLTVADNGCGFMAGQAPPNGHYGLRGMAERAAVLGGKLTITSSPETGTKITLAAPIAGAEE